MRVATGAGVAGAPPAPARTGGTTAVRRRSGAYARAVEEAEAEEHRHRIETAFRRHYRTLVAICHERTADPSRAEDLAQETLVRALRYGHTFDPSRPILPWLRTIAARVVIDDAERAASQRETVIDLTGTDELVDDGFADSVGDHPALATAFARLSAVQQTALRLRFLEDWSGTETARFLGVSRAACDQLVCRAKRRLRDELDLMGERHPALVPLTSGGFFTRMRYAAAQRRAGITGWDTTMTSLGAVVENVALALALTIASVTLPGIAAAVEFGMGFGGEATARAMDSAPTSVTASIDTPDVPSRPVVSSTTDEAVMTTPVHDGASARTYSLRPTDNAGLADAPPTAADARLAEDDRQAEIEVEAEVSILGFPVAVEEHHDFPCEGPQETAGTTCATVERVNEELPNRSNDG